MDDLLLHELLDALHSANWALRRIAKEIPGDDKHLGYGTWDLVGEGIDKTEVMLDKLTEIEWNS